MITFADRKNAVLKEMARQGLDTLLIVASGRHMIDEPDAVVHLTGFLSMGPSVVLLRADGNATLVTTPATDAERVAAHTLVAEAVVADDLFAALRKVWPAKPGRVGTVNRQVFPFSFNAEMKQFCGDGAVAFDASYYAVTRRKTAEEIDRARRGIAIAERGWRRVQEIARPGLRECDVNVQIYQYMREIGADDIFFIMNSKPRTAEEKMSSQRVLKDGDMLMGEPSPRCEGQYAQICRLASLGEPTEELATKYALLCQGLRAGIDVVKPGVKMADVCAAIDDSLAAAGYAEYSRPPHIKRRGHGFGCGSVAPGDVALDNHTVLEEDMMFMIHPNQVLPGPGFMMCGDPVVVTATGVEVLTKEVAKLAVIRF